MPARIRKVMPARIREVMPARIRAGISGWRYPPWRGTFYPKSLPQRCELEYASQRLPVIEINGTFYSLQKPASFAQWYAQTPADFVFSVKGPQYITHIRRLHEVETPLANFFASGLFNLREKLGPILWQFPPNFKFDEERMRAFFELLPFSTAAAASLARKRDGFMKGRARVGVDADRPLRHVIEVRHDSFGEARFVELLREFGIALVVAESAGKWPSYQDVTADFMYLRLHGDEDVYESGYSDSSLGRWAKRIEAWHAGREPKDAHRIIAKATPRARHRDVFCFFDNTEVKLKAPFDAQSLMDKLKVAHGP